MSARDLYLQIRRVEEALAALRRLAEQSVAAEQLSEEYLAFERQFPTGTIYHITPQSYYETISITKPYLPEAYTKDGFIHCTRGADLMVMVANNFYRSVPGDFLMLVIDVHALTSPLKYEALDPATVMPFPHIYGPLNREAIVEVVKMRRGDDGRFLAPPF